MASVEDSDQAAPKAKKQKTGGFKWKDKRAADTDERKERGSEGLHRGYRDRSPRRDTYREREKSPRRDDNRERDDLPRRDDYHDREREPRRDDHRGQDSYRPREDRRREDDGGQRNRSPRRYGQADSYRPAASGDKTSELSQSAADKFGLSTSKSDKKDKQKKTPKVAPPSEPMIVVNINDRLGTKASIPCFASDSVKAFKAIVAAHIGRQPHEIMLKRQGERPFKDQLTLEDYGVSSGVQLDLEIDTGD